MTLEQAKAILYGPFPQTKEDKDQYLLALKLVAASFAIIPE